MTKQFKNPFTDKKVIDARSKFENRKYVAELSRLHEENKERFGRSVVTHVSSFEHMYNDKEMCHVWVVAVDGHDEDIYTMINKMDCPEKGKSVILVSFNEDLNSLDSKVMIVNEEGAKSVKAAFNKEDAQYLSEIAPTSEVKEVVDNMIKGM